MYNKPEDVFLSGFHLYTWIVLDFGHLGSPWVCVRFLPEDFCRMIRGDGPYPCGTKRLRAHAFKNPLIEGWDCDEL